jgi:hypothetical protein
MPTKADYVPKWEYLVLRGGCLATFAGEIVRATRGLKKKKARSESAPFYALFLG